MAVVHFCALKTHHDFFVQKGLSTDSAIFHYFIFWQVSILSYVKWYWHFRDIFPLNWHFRFWGTCFYSCFIKNEFDFLPGRYHFVVYYDRDDVDIALDQEDDQDGMQCLFNWGLIVAFEGFLFNEYENSGVNDLQQGDRRPSDENPGNKTSSCRLLHFKINPSEFEYSVEAKNWVGQTSDEETKETVEVV